MALVLPHKRIILLGNPERHPLLMAHWKMNESSGLRLDSHRANHLTDDNGTVTQAVGKIDNAAQFASASVASLSITDNAFLSMGDIDFTITLWLWLDDKAATYGILGKGNIGGGGNALEYFLRYDSAIDRLRIFVGNGSSNTVLSANNFGSPTTGAWHFVVMWHDSVANTINLQVNDGTADSTSHTGGSQDSSFELAIGRNPNASTNRLNGRIDSVSVWKRVLTSTERTLLYNGGNGLDYPFSGIG